MRFDLHQLASDRMPRVNAEANDVPQRVNCAPGKSGGEGNGKRSHVCFVPEAVRAGSMAGERFLPSGMTSPPSVDAFAKSWLASSHQI
jgi:hypothetical protein